MLMVAAARRVYWQACRQARSAFVWALEKFRARAPSWFWAFLKVRILPPVPGLDAFADYFHGLFGLGASSSELASLVAYLDAAEVPAFTAEEV